MKYQKAKSVIHQFQAAKEELASRRESLLSAELRVKDASIEVVRHEAWIKSNEAIIEDSNRQIAELQKRIEEILADKTRYVAELQQARNFLVNEPEEVKRAKQSVVTHKERIVAQMKVVERWEKDLPEAQKVFDDIKTREMINKAAQVAVTQQAKKNALEELTKAQQAGVIPAGVDLNQVVEKYFDGSEPKKLGRHTMIQQAIAR